MSTTQSPTGSIACNAEIVSNGEVKEKALPLKGKYDGRGRWERSGAESKPGPKPLWRKTLQRNKCAKVIQEIDAIASPAKMFERAYSANNLELAWRIREDVHNRWSGKPFVAVNPEESRKPNVLNDNRLQIAVQQLLPGAKRTGKRTVKLDSKPDKLLTTQEGNENHIFSPPEPGE